MKLTDKEIEAISRKSMEDESEKLDDKTRDRLHAMRQTALNAIPSDAKPRHDGSRYTKIGASFAAIILAGVITLFNIHDPQESEFTDLEILSDIEDIEVLVENDIEFYVWLESYEEEPKG